MTLSVIIPVYGRVNLLIQCLQSLNRDIQGDLDYSVCVVDDGSEIDEEFVRTGTQASYPLVWRSFSGNKGRSAARNEGIRATDSDIIVFLDSDLEAMPGFLKAHMECHKENPRIAVIGKVIWPAKGSFLRYIGTRGISKISDGDQIPPWYFVTCNSSICRKDIPGDDLFDEQINLWGGEDLDAGMRLSASGVRFAYAPDAVSYHHFSRNITHHTHLTYLYGRNTLPTLIKRYPELYNVVRLDILESFYGRFAIKKPVFYTLQTLARIFDFLPLPEKLFDYLTFAAYARGLQEGKRT
ncbi:MAG: glycosyltransferase family 2 protein [Candidatus Latescibacteria bacterium]|nr:glycosyltransferase family 2 protein [Candidatus Latescibacterota bacterium]